MSGMHKIKAVVIECIDFRFQTAIKEYLEKNGYEGSYDLVSVAGSSKDLAKPAGYDKRDYVLGNLKVSIKLHGPSEILVFDHQECGAYAADGSVKVGIPREEDFNLHVDFLKRAKSILNNEFPDVKVRLFYIDLDMKVVEVQ